MVLEEKEKKRQKWKQICVELVMNAAAGTWDGEALVKSKHAETLHQVAIAEMMCLVVVWPNVDHN